MNEEINKLRKRINLLKVQAIRLRKEAQRPEDVRQKLDAFIEIDSTDQQSGLTA